MTGHVLAVLGGKGGVGKTTTAINAAVALQDAGHDVAVVDADLGTADLGGYLDVDGEPSIHDVLAGDAAVDEAVVDGPGGVDVLHGERSLDAFARSDPAALRPTVRDLADAHDAVVVDTGTDLSRATVAPVRAADAAVLVTTPDEVAIADARKLGTLAARNDCAVAGCVLTRAGPETSVADVEDRLGEDVVAVVPDDPAATAAEPLFLTAGESYAAQAYRRLVDKLTDRLDAAAGATADA